MRAERVAPGLWRVLKGYVNAYAIEADDGLTLVDCGLPNRDGRIAAAIRAAGHDVGDVRHILLTHHHVDHTGSLPALAAATGADVYVHAADAGVVRGDRAMPGPNSAVLTGRLLGPLIFRFVRSRSQPAKVDHELVGGEDLPIAGGIRAIHTPGHTAGETSFLLPRDGGILIAGDAARTIPRLGPPVGPMFGMFTEDLAEAERSYRKLAELEFDVAVVGHGNPIVGNASERFRASLNKRAR